MGWFTVKEELKRLNLKNPVHLLATGFGAGFSPIMPGTMGTLVAIPLYLLLVLLLSPQGYLLFIAVAFLVGIYLCRATGKRLGVADHGAIVWDEIVGFLITMIAIPLHWQWILLGFILFRLFDIIKPPPIGWIDRNIKGGLGVMADDLVAGIMAWVVLYLVVWLMPIS
ncbi:MAG: phosphatidylglycerophosphatase A family protein [Enterobacteriaceae bacterium]